MKKLRFILPLLVLLMFTWACTKDYPNPQFPETSQALVKDFEALGLKAPISGTPITVDLATPATFAITWDSTKATNGSAITYKWKAVLAATATFATPLLDLVSDNAGKNARLTLTTAALDAALQTLGITPGQTANLKWNVEATTADGKKKMANTAYTIDIFRKPQTTPVIFELANFPKSTPSNAKVFLAGKFGFMGLTPAGDWQQPGTVAGLELTKDPISGTYKITINMTLNQEVDQFKFFVVPNGTPSTWSNGEQRFKYSDGSAEGVPNRSWKFTGTNTNPKFSAAKWENLGTAPAQLSKFVVKPDVSVVIPAGKSVYLAGEISGTASYAAYFEKSGDWSQPGSNPANELSFDSGTGEWYVWLPIGNAGSKNFKPFVAAGDAPSWNSGMAKANCTGEGDQSFNFTGTNGPIFTGIRFEKVAPCPL